MRRFLGWAASAAMAVAMVGCASLSTPSVPCEKCDYGYVYLGKRSELRRWCNNPNSDKPSCCIKDGKILDCTKNPMECPECAKAAQK